MKSLKKTLLLICSIALVLLLMPAMAFAHSSTDTSNTNGDAVASITSGDTTYYYTDLGDAINDAESGDEVVIKCDINILDTITIKKDLTLNVNGKTINNKDAAKGVRAIRVDNGATVTIDGEGYFIAGEGNDTGDNSSLVDVRNGTLNIDSGTFTSANTCIGTSSSSAVVNVNKATMNAKFGGTCLLAVNGGTINVYGLTFYGDSDDNRGCGCAWAGGRAGTGTINIYGGTFTSYPITANQVTIAGEVEGTNYCLYDYHDAPNDYTKGTINVYGGSFINYDPSGVNEAKGTSNYIVSYVADGFEVVSATSGDMTTYTVCSPVAQIGEVKYATLQDAFDAAPLGETVVLIKDIDLKDQVVVSKTVTLDLAGHGIYNTADIWGNGSWSLISVQGAGNLTINDTSVNGNGSMFAKANDCYALDLRDEGTSLTINGGTYNGNITAVYAHTGMVTINGGTYKIQQLSDYNDCRYTLNCLDGNFKNGSAGFTVKGGTFYNFDPSNNAAEGAGTNFVKVGYTVNSATSAGDTIYTVVKAQVAQIGTKKYETLADAVAAVPTDGTPTTITMIADEAIEVNVYAVTIPSNKNVVLDLNGHEVVGACASEGTSALIRNLGTLTIENSSSDPNKGRLVGGADPTWTWDGSDDYSGSYASNLIRNEGTLIVNGGTLYNVSSGSAAYAVDNYSAGKVTINGGTLDAKKASAIRMFNCDGGKVTVTGGTIGHYNNENDSSYMGIQVMSGTNSDVEITGGNLYGNYAIYSNGTGNSSVLISGGTFHNDVAFGSNGPSDISITGGRFESRVGTWGTQTGFISGGLYTEVATEDIADYIANEYWCIHNTDTATKAAYPYMVVKKEVAQVGGVKYPTLADAIAAVPTDGTATTVKILVEKIALGRVSIDDGRNVVLDLDGKVVYAAANLYNGKLTVANGHLCSYGQTINVYGSADSNKAAGAYNELTVASNAQIGNGGSYYGIILRDVSAALGASKYAYGSKINVNGTVTDCIWVMGNITDGNSVIDINKRATVVGEDVAIALQGNATVNVKGGTIKGDETGIEVRAGKLNITDGEITGNGIPVEVTANGNGTTSKGAGVAIAQHTTKQAVKVNISGGTINGFSALYESDPEGNSASDLKKIDLSVTGGHFNVINHTGDYEGATKVSVYSEDFTGFLTGGIYSAEPAADYVAPSYKAVQLTKEGDAGKYQVGYATVDATTEGSLSAGTVEYKVNTVVRESETSTTEPIETINNLTVTVSDNNADEETAGEAGKAPAALENIADITTLNTIVEEAIEEAGASIDNGSQTVEIEITLVKSAADTSVDGKVTYEVHPEAIIKVDRTEVGTVKVENSQLNTNNTFSFKLYAGEIAAVGQRVKVTHKSGDTSTDAGTYGVDEKGYITVTGIHSFSEFELEPVDIPDTGSVKLSANLTLQDNININLHVHALKDGTNAADYTVTSVFEDKTVVNNVKLADPSVTTYEGSDGTTWYKLKVAEVYSYQMGNKAHIQVIYQGAVIRDFYYSVRDYFEKAYDRETGTMKKLCASGLDYGAAAQVYFDGKTVGDYTYHTDPANLVNATVNPDNIVTAKEPTGYSPTVVKDGLDVSKVRASLILGSEVSLKVYFKYAGNKQDLHFAAVRSGDSTARTVSEIEDLGDGVYAVKITGIKCFEMWRDYTLTISDNATNTYKLTYSPYLYAQQNWNNAQDEKLAKLCKALVAYGDYAHELWPNA